MKIAVVTDDHQTISSHFGRAAYYDVFTIEDGKIVGRESVHKSNHHHMKPDEPHQAGHHHNHDHNSMMEPILDCHVLIARGMGMGAYNALKIRSIEPIVTNVEKIESAVSAYLQGRLINHPEYLH